MPKLEEGKTEGTFIIDNIPYQKGAFEIKINNGLISIVRNSNADITVNNPAALTQLAEWVSVDNHGFTSLGQFIDYAEPIIHFSPLGSAAKQKAEAKHQNSIETTLNSMSCKFDEMIFLLKNISE